MATKIVAKKRNRSVGPKAEKSTGSLNKSQRSSKARPDKAIKNGKAENANKPIKAIKSYNKADKHSKPFKSDKSAKIAAIKVKELQVLANQFKVVTENLQRCIGTVVQLQSEPLQAEQQI